jgi:uncharacterized protein
MAKKQTNNPITLLLTLLISGYQLLISPYIASRCRFYPTCSSYAKEALLTVGLFKGLFLIGKRLSKCHAFHPGGIDMIGDTHSC